MTIYICVDCMFEQSIFFFLFALQNRTFSSVRHILNLVSQFFSGAVISTLEILKPDFYLEGLRNVPSIEEKPSKQNTKTPDLFCSD